MNRALLVLLTLLAGGAFAQVRLLTNVDGGMPRTTVNAPDAGVPEPAKPPPPVARLPDPEVERLHREIADLKAVVERQASQVDTLVTSLEKVGKQVAAVRADLADAEQRQADEKQRLEARRAATSQALSGVEAALQQLSMGNSNVGDALRLTDGAFTGNAARAVQYAKAALANGDLSAARTWLSIAVSEATYGRE